MTDLANLEIQIRAKGVEEARRALGELAKAAVEVESAVDEMGRGTREVGRATGQAERAADRLGRELDNAGKSARKTGQESSRAADKIDELDTSSRRAAGGARELDESAEQLGRTAGGLSGSLGGLSTILGALGGAVSFGALVGTLNEFEDGLVGVSKTTGISGAALAELEAGIEGLATQSSAAVADLFGIAQSAGQLGIQGGESILLFTDAVAKLTDAAPSLRGSSEETALALARILAVSGESTDNVTALASTIALLGDSFATVESSVLATGLEVAKAGAAFGVSAEEALGLATAFDVIGTEAELSRSAIVQVFGEITKAVAEGSERLEGFSASAGLSSEAFADLFRSSPVEALQAFLGGLGELGDAGAETTLVLDSLGLTSVRLQPTLLTLAKNSDILRDALAAAAAEFENPTKLQREFEAGSDRLGAALQRLANTAKVAVDNFADDSTGLAGGLRGVVEASTDALRVLAGLDDQVQGSRGVAAATAGAFAGLGTAIGIYAAAAGTAKIATIALNSTLLSTPVGAVAVGVGALVGAVVALDGAYSDINGKSVSFIDDLKVIGGEAMNAAEAFLGLPESASVGLGGTLDILAAISDRITGLLLTPFEAIGIAMERSAEQWRRFGDVISSTLAAIQNGDWSRALESLNEFGRGGFEAMDLGDIVAEAFDRGQSRKFASSLLGGVREELDAIVGAVNVTANQIRLSRSAGVPAEAGGATGTASLPGVDSAPVAGPDGGAGLEAQLEGLAARLARLGQTGQDASRGLGPLSTAILGAGVAAANAAGRMALLAAEQDRARQASLDLIEGLKGDAAELDFALEQVLRSGPEARKAAVLRDVAATLRDAGVAGEAAGQVLDDFSAKLDRLTELERLNGLARGFADALGDGLKSAVLDIENADEALRNLAARLGEVALDRLVIDPFVQGTGDALAGLAGGSVGEAAADAGLQSASALLQTAGTGLQAAGSTHQAAASGLQAAAAGLQSAASALQGSAASDLGEGIVEGAAAGATASARGNAFVGGGVMRFANGGAFGQGLRGRFGDVIRSQVAFPMGIAGEAGPEAIMPGRLAGGRFLVGAVQNGQRMDLPLARDAGGELVVDMGRRFAAGAAFGPGLMSLPAPAVAASSSGEAGNSYQFTYNIQTPDADSFRRSRSQIEADARQRYGESTRRRV